MGNFFFFFIYINYINTSTIEVYRVYLMKKNINEFESLPFTIEVPILRNWVTSFLYMIYLYIYFFLGGRIVNKLKKEN